MKHLAAFVILLAPLAAQQPRVSNGRVETRAVTSLQSDFKTIVASLPAPAWIGYAVPKTASGGNSCCYSDSNRGCGLEGDTNFTNTTSKSGPVQLEGDRFAAILFRIDQRAVQKVRHFSLDCDLDAGGLPFIWLTAVKPTESLSLLESLVQSSQKDPIAAIAAHADPAADRLLESFVAPSQPTEIRQKTVFWLGAARGKRGYEILNKLVREDRDEKVRDKAIFALSISKEPEAVDAMIRVAKEDSSAHVRGQAIFWLGQKAGRKAIGAISDAIAGDPETEVKKKAVFALSQLPKDQGVPLLIGVARDNRNPAVRKQAFFWLGQSKDPRALEYLESVLTK
jgi:hypothetical protein